MQSKRARAISLARGRRCIRSDAPAERFLHPDAKKAIGDLGLDANKHVLLITGASSGSTRINEAICRLLPKLEAFADRWQIVHLTGLDNYKAVLDGYRGTRLSQRCSTTTTAWQTSSRRPIW